jgi:hypothetical protein
MRSVTCGGMRSEGGFGSPGKTRTCNPSVNSLEPKFITSWQSRANSKGISKFRQNGISRIHLLFSVKLLTSVLKFKTRNEDLLLLRDYPFIAILAGH